MRRKWLGYDMSYNVYVHYSPLWAYSFFGCLHGGIFTKGLIRIGGLKISLIVGHIPVEIFLLVSYFFDATRASNRIFVNGVENFR